VQELEQKVGRNNPDLAILLNILAVIYREQGRFKEAIRVLQETLEIRESVFGTTHAIVASTLNNLSVLHGKCGDFKTAEPFCQRALKIRQAVSTGIVVQTSRVLLALCTAVCVSFGISILESLNFDIVMHNVSESLLEIKVT
jgi:tetratricopeptide (TPR) repeat protein